MPFFTINSTKHIFPTPGQSESILESICPSLSACFSNGCERNARKSEDFDTFLVGRTVGKRWRVGEIIHKDDDSNSIVHEGYDLLTNVKVTIKTEPHRALNRCLYSEIEIYKRIHMASGDDPESGFAVLLDYGDDLGYSFMVLKLLGPSLESMVQGEDTTEENEEETDSIASTVIIATCQLLKVLQNLHSYGYVHGNVNASNVMKGTDENEQNTVHLADLKNCKTWRNNQTGSHQDAHNTSEIVSRRSDMKDVSKMLASLLRKEEKKKKSGCCGLNKMFGKPKSPKNKTRDADNEFDDLMENVDSRCAVELKQFWSYCSTLKDDELPDYENLRGILHIMYWNINSSLLPPEVLQNPTAPRSEGFPKSSFMNRRRESVLKLGETVLSRFVQVDITP